MLLQFCGGVWLGADLAQQHALVRASAEERRSLLQTLGLRCAPDAMAKLRRDLERFHPSAIRLSAPLPGDSWGGSPQRRYGLRADDDPLHPYPVEIDLPAWVLDSDPDLRRWLLAHGSGIRIEAPTALVEEHRQALAQALSLYAPAGQEGSCGPTSPAPPPEPAPRTSAAVRRAGDCRSGQTSKRRRPSVC